MKINRLVVYLVVVLILVSCGDDDDGVPGTVVPPQTLAETAIENDAEIKVLLESHTYNYEDFEEPIDENFDFEIEIQKIEGDFIGKIPLSELVQTETISVSSEDVGRSEESEVVNHLLYYLEVVKGKGVSPTYADRITTNYLGSFLDGNLFDGRSVPINQYVPFTVRGYGRFLQKLSGGTGFVENDNGTVTFNDFGVGMVFIPSGLTYFDRPPQGSGIPQYEPLVFEISLLDVEENTDFDDDGIPSIMEDLNNDGNLNNDNTDADLEPLTVFLPNHNDPDDDGDGILTRDEIEIDEEGNITFPDCDNDGTPDYLDTDSCS